MSEHLDFDTDFLTKSTPAKNGAPSTPPSKSNNKWKPWLVGGGIMLGVIILVAVSDSPSSPSVNPSPQSTHTTPNSPDEVSVGHFRCSSYNATRANTLKPNISDGTIKLESDSIDTRSSVLRAQKNRIDSMYVDESDQNSIDIYNAQVDNYNNAKDRLNADIDTYESRRSQYNTQVDVYNSFLNNNCTPA